MNPLEETDCPFIIFYLTKAMTWNLLFPIPSEGIENLWIYENSKKQTLWIQLCKDLDLKMCFFLHKNVK